MGGPCILQVAHPKSALARAAIESARAEIVRIERAFSRFRPDSIISRLNASAGKQAVQCDDETCALLDAADALYRSSEGLFDVTSGVLRRAWRFGLERGSIPDAQALKPLLGLIGWDSVQREGNWVRMPRPGMEIDLGGIGKEYAADRVVRLWRALGVPHGLVNLAGDVCVIGGHPDGRPWRLGVRHPRREGALLAELPLRDGALATSGDYERYMTDSQGRRHCHILNPRTGSSASHWQSISVVAPLAVVAGGFCTVAMLMDESAPQWLAQQGVDFLAVDSSGALHNRASGTAAA
jgi:thiamine biosynthesis lipoprotein